MIDKLIPWLGIVKAAAIVFALILAFRFGLITERESNQRETIKEEQAARDALAGRIEKLNDLAQDLETMKHERQAKAQIITETIEKIVDRPVYKLECVDSLGLSVINDALAGSGKPDATLSAAPPVDR